MTVLIQRRRRTFVLVAVPAAVVLFCCVSFLSGWYMIRSVLEAGGPGVLDERMSWIFVVATTSGGLSAISGAWIVMSPRIRPKRRFRLRSLFIIFTLFAGGLAVIGHRMERLHNYRLAQSGLLSTPEQQLVGTWTPAKTNLVGTDQLTFKADRTLVITQWLDQGPAVSSTLHWKLESNAGQLLVREETTTPVRDAIDVVVGLVPQHSWRETYLVSLHNGVLRSGDSENYVVYHRQSGDDSER